MKPNLQNKITVLERLQAPTPQIFALIRNIGLLLAIIGGSLIRFEEQGFDLPQWLTMLANHATWLAGIVAAIVAQLTVDFDKLAKEKQLSGIK